MEVMGFSQELDFRHRQQISCPKRLDQLRGPRSLLFNMCWRLSPEENARGVKLTTYFHLVPSVRMSGAVPPLSGAQGQLYHFVITNAPIRA
jgi:hypothetical protein